MNIELPKRFITVIAALQDAVDKSDKSMEELATLTGFESEKALRDVVDGRVALDGHKVKVVARALHMNAVELARVWVADYFSDYVHFFDAIPDEFWRAQERVYRLQQETHDAPATQTVVSRFGNPVAAAVACMNCSNAALT